MAGKQLGLWGDGPPPQKPAELPVVPKSIRPLVFRLHCLKCGGSFRVEVVDLSDGRVIDTPCPACEEGARCPRLTRMA